MLKHPLPGRGCALLIPNSVGVIIYVARDKGVKTRNSMWKALSKSIKQEICFRRLPKC